MTAKPPVVLVHGMGSSFDHNWRRYGWVDRLEAEGRTVVGFELPGHGSSPILASDGDTAQGRLAELLEGLGQVDLVGFSAGSIVSLTVAARRPELVRRAVLMGLGDRQLTMSQEERERNLTASSASMRTIRVAAERAGNDPDAVVHFAMHGHYRPALEEVSGVTASVLLVLGERDFVAPADRLLELIPDSRLVVLPGVEHFTTAAQPEALAAAVDFLQADSGLESGPADESANQSVDLEVS